MLSVGLLAQSETYLNHDVGWVLYSTKQMLNGAVFGKDIIEPNPPLIWWVSSIPVAISDALGTSVIGTFRAFVLLLTCLSLFIADRFIVALGGSQLRRVMFLVTGAYLFTVAVNRDFGQREHLAALLVLPYIFAIAHRMDGRVLPVLGAIAIGTVAGVGLAFKPYFVFVPLLLEVALIIRIRSLRSLVRPEALGGGIAIALYAIALMSFAKPWLFDALPDIWRVYWAFDQPLTGLWVSLAMKFAPPLLATFVILRNNPSAQSLALFLSAVGFFFAAAIQGKYYQYHLYPAFALLVLSSAIGLPGVPAKWRIPAAGIFVAVLIQNLNESTMSLLARSDYGAFGRNISSVVAFVDENSERGGSFLAVSTHPYPGFPTALYANRRWSSASNSQFYLPAVVRLRASGASANTELIAFAERKAREGIQRDLANGPDVVLFDQQRNRHAIGQSKFNFLEFYLEDPEFRATWRAYKRVDPAPQGFAAYVRRGG